MSGRIRRRDPSVDGYRSRSNSRDGGDNMYYNNNSNSRGNGGRKRPRGGQSSRAGPNVSSSSGTGISNTNADFAELKGLQPIRPDLLSQIEERAARDEKEQAGFKDSCDIFIGNFGTNVQPSEMRDFLATAMTRLGLCKGAREDPIKDCRMNKNFCFIELTNRTACSKSLNLNGIPFHGNALRISRPNKYDGPESTSTTWSQLIDHSSSSNYFNSNQSAAGSHSVPPRPSPRLDAGSGGNYFNAATTAAVAASGDLLDFAAAAGAGAPPDPASKPFRELFLGNTDGDRTAEVDLQALIGGALLRLGMASSSSNNNSSNGSGSENPLYIVRVNGKYGFMEAWTAADAANLLNLDGIPFRGTKLKICRPSKFDGGLGGEKYFSWEELRFRWQQGDVKLMTAGTPSKVLLVTNMATLGELQNVDTYLDVIEDTRLECSLYGTVRSVLVPRSSDAAYQTAHGRSGGTTAAASSVAAVGGKVFIEMATVEQATNTLLALKGRSFNNRIVDVKFYPEDLFRAMNYSFVQPDVVVTKSDGALPMERVYTPFAMSRINNNRF